MSDIAAKVLADDDVPCRAVAPIELFLDVCGDVLLNVVFVESGIGNVDGFLLELFAHVDILDDSFGSSRRDGNTAGGSVDGGGIGFDICHGENEDGIEEDERREGYKVLWRAIRWHVVWGG